MNALNTGSLELESCNGADSITLGEEERPNPVSVGCRTVNAIISRGNRASPPRSEQFPFRICFQFDESFLHTCCQHLCPLK